MEVQEQTNKPFFSGNFMQVIYKYRKHLVIIAILSIVLSIIFSGPSFITPLYKSDVILYPTASKSISKALLSETPGNTKDILEFGEEEQTEQMLQVLNSNKIRDRIISKYNLLEHYKISPGSKYKMTELYRRYDNNFRFRRTEYMAVKIIVYDKDAQMAADMANDIAELVDSTINHMQKEVAVKAFKIVENDYLSLKHEIEIKEDSLTVLRELGVHDYESQSEMFNRQLAIEMAKGNTAGVKRLEDRLEILAKYGGPYVSLRDALEHDKKQLSEVKAKYDEAKVDATESLPHKFIVSSAYKAEKKSYPIRWLIVLIATFSALFLAVIFFGAFEILSGRVGLDFKKKSLKSTFYSKRNIFNELKTESKTPELEINEKKEINPLAKKPATGEKQSQVNENEGVGIKYTSNKKIKEYKVKSDSEKQVVSEELNNTEMSNFFNSSNLLNLVRKWKYHLLVIIGVAAILAMIFSGPTFITPKYKSYAIAYPANIEPYSEESETEQMLQIINSQDIIDSVIKKFNLPKHYKIDRNYKYYRTTILYEYSQNVKINKTPFESVMIEVYDKSPDTAKLIVDAILNFYNEKIASLHKSKYAEVIDMYETQLNYKKHSLDSLRQIMYTLGTDYGLFEYEYQSQEIMRGYLKTLTGNGVTDVNTKEVKRLLNSMENKSGQLVEVVQMIEDESRAYVEIKQDYEMAMRFYKSKMTYSNIVTYPFVADKKSYPIRWLIVVVVSIAAFVFSMLIILFVEKRKNI